MSARYPISRGQARLRLIAALAQGDKNYTELGLEFGVTKQAVQQFAQRHAAEVERAVLDLTNSYSGLWIADKAARIAEYQQVVDDITSQIEASLPDPDAPITAQSIAALPDLDVDLLRVKLAALRSVAEEMGQLPARLTVKHEGTVRTEIVGLDLSALQ